MFNPFYFLQPLTEKWQQILVNTQKILGNQNIMSSSIAALHELVLETKAKVDSIPGLITAETTQLTALIEKVKAAPPLEDPAAIALQNEIIQILSSVNSNLDSIGEGIKGIVPEPPVAELIESTESSIIGDEEAQVE